MPNIKIIINYDGTDFHGWQIQPSTRTVQGELVKSLHRITQENVNIIASGRTDAGVHAASQVANFHISKYFKPKKLTRALNGTLPRDIRVLSVEIVDDKFNARFDAVRRFYQYTINKQPVAIGRHYTYYYPFHLNTELMRTAAQQLLGTHDFTSFCKSKSDVYHHMCSVEKLDVVETDHIIRFDIIANRFLHNMVRSIVGTLLEFGIDKKTPQQMQDILKSKDRRAAGENVPPHGLCLVRVDY